MNRHSAHVLLVAAVVGTVAVGCAHGPSPRRTLSKYLDASLHERHEEAYKYISTEDKASKSLEEYLSERAEEDNLRNALADKVSYRIGKVAKTGDRAQADVKIKVPDVGEILGDVFALILKSFLDEDKDLKELEEELTRKYRGGDLPMTTVTESFELVRETDGWKIALDW